MARGLATRFFKALRYREDTSDLLVCAGVGWPPGTVGEVALATDRESPAGYASFAREPVRSNHLTGESKFRTPLLVRDNGVLAAINVPILAGERPYGVREADGVEAITFTPDDSTFMLQVANMLAVALERSNARRATVRA